MPFIMFITGTDTEIGKTFVSQQLLSFFKQKGLSTVALKPVSAGCQLTPAGWRNEDALALQQAATCLLPYEQVNPIALRIPVSPHLAAKAENTNVTAEDLYRLSLPVLHQEVDVIIIEGAGGWFAPINEYQTLADYVKLLRCPVLLVVGMKLGCLNHTLLTVNAIRQQGIKLIGWVANCVTSDMLMLEENIKTLEQKQFAPLLATIPYIIQPSQQPVITWNEKQLLRDLQSSHLKKEEIPSF
ncbi:MAG: dethiobiotin synthase [Gammaproteobacteria bacterium]